MKVSRKVGRRSRKHTSSISRRRLRSKKSYKKNSYRKKNAKTQKGGKRGRGYKRMRSHTHKRGKGFHGGGGDDDNCYRELHTQQDQLLTYKKKREVFSEEKPFAVSVFGSNDSCYSSSNWAKIVLVRNTSEKPLTVTMDFSYQGASGEMAQILSNGSGSNNSNYSFNYPENKDFFSSMFDKINRN